jgi:hypothetical protein
MEDDYGMNEEDPDHESLEAKVREMARQLGRSVERAMEGIDLDEVADRIDVESERLKEMVELAARWLGEQTATGSAPTPEAGPQSRPSTAPRRPRRIGPHPLDVPTEEQGRALSGLASGRWTVQAGTHVLIDESGDAIPASEDVIGDLRARDWITASGEVTLVGEDALRRWLAGDD